MDNQLELFSQAQAYPDMCELLKKIENQYNFPNGTISLNKNISQKGVNKGSAVESLAKYLGVDKSEVITFGDNHNDLSMIMYAGMGVAMGNAEDIVKENSNFITDKNTENGVAKALENILKIDLK